MKPDNATRFLGKQTTVTVDRPMGSAHPTHGWEYPINYGYVAGTNSPDGEPVDAYIIGVDEPVASFVGTCIAVIHRTNDDDDKLVVAAPGTVYTDEQIRTRTHFQEQFFDSVIVRQ